MYKKNLKLSIALHLVTSFIMTIPAFLFLLAIFEDFTKMYNLYISLGWFAVAYLFALLMINILTALVLSEV